MQLDAIAQRYADALYQWAQDANKLNDVADELDQLNAGFPPELYDVMNNPSVVNQNKVNVLASLHDKLSAPVRNLLFLLLEHQRFSAFPEVVTQYHQMVNTSQGKVEGVLYTAAPVDASILADVANGAKHFFNVQDIHLTNTVNPELLGGAQLQVGDQRIDGSYLTQLNQLKVS